MCRNTMTERNIVSAKIGKSKRNRAMSTCRCIISFTIGSMGAADGACVSDGLIGEGSTVMRLGMRGEN